jgi:hypothetical protein
MQRLPNTFVCRALPLFIMLVCMGVTTTMPTSPAGAQSPRTVLAYYFGWYTGDSWNDGRLIDRPAQPYASTDAGAVGRQIDEARSAGIDGFVMSWFGPKGGNLTHIVFNSLLDQAAARGFAVAASVDMQQGDFNANTGEVLESLRYLIGDRVNHPAYYRYNGKPVIYFWNQGRFSVSEWRTMRGEVDPNRSTIWVMEGTNTGYLSVFDGLYLFNTAWARNPASTARQWRATTLNAGGTFYTPTVLPGWDESRIAGRSNPTSPQQRSGGAFLTNSWNGAVASGADVILIVSWNEYLENSHIEPSQQHGSAALDTLRPLIGAWKNGAPNPPAAPQTSGGGTLSPLSRVNVRAAASTGAQILGVIAPGETYTVIGQVEGWYLIDYLGQQGYVAAGYVQINQ